MALKNYTTSIAVEKTIAEIEKILAKAGATHIMKMYDNEGNPKSLGFRYEFQGKNVAFMLPMEEERVLQVFRNSVNNGELPKRYYNDVEQVRKTGWRILKDWVHSQMALIEIRVVKFTEIFLPYMYNEKLGKTMYQLLEDRNFNLQLEDKTEEEKVT